MYLNQMVRIQKNSNGKKKKKKKKSNDKNTKKEWGMGCAQGQQKMINIFCEAIDISR